MLSTALAAALLLLGPFAPQPKGPAQDQAPAIAFAQACLDATRDAVVLNVAAHPDDEAARTMVVWRHAHGARTVTLYATCGGGGQNAVGREIGPRLAAVRIRETLAAARHTGTRVRWLGFEDFGYSKSRAETVARWGGEAAVLERFRREIEAISPDLVFTNHGVDRGHGHHRAVAWAVREVCAERGTPLFERVYEGEGGFAIDPSPVDPLRGTTYARQAHDGWREHRTQGPWPEHDPARVKPDRWLAANGPARALGDDLVAALPSLGEGPLGVAEPHTVLRELAAFAEDRDPSARVAGARRLLPPLRAAFDRLVPGAPLRARLGRRLEALERVVVIGAGIELEAELEDARVARGGQAAVRVALRGAELPFRARCGAGSEVESPGGAPVTCRIDVPRAPPAGDPAARLTESVSVPVRVAFALDGLPVSVEGAVELRLGPGLRVAWPREAVFVPAGEPWERELSLEVESFDGGAGSAPVAIRAPAGLQVAVDPAVVETARDRTIVRVRLRDEGGTTTSRCVLRARVGDAAPARLEVQPFDATAARRLRVALVRGPDDTLERFLADLGVACASLDDEGLAAADLAGYSTLLIDIRAYHHRPDLAAQRERIHEFVRGGGRVLVCYHKPSEWNPRDDRPQLAPFELVVGDGRVSEEDAPVELLAPAHPLLARPFALRPDDFDGWVQERGLNFAVRWAPEFVPLLRMHDAGEPPLEGGLLVAEDGAGDFVFCALALYRQLRVGHAGAARLLVNLLTPR